MVCTTKSRYHHYLNICISAHIHIVFLITAPLKLKKLPKRKDPKNAVVQSEDQENVLTAYKLSKFYLEIAKNDVKDIWVRSSVGVVLFNMSALSVSCLSFFFIYFIQSLSSSVIQKLAVDTLDISGEKAEAKCEKLKAKADAILWKVELLDNICQTLDVVIAGSSNPAASACYLKGNNLSVAWVAADATATTCKNAMKTIRPWLKTFLLKGMYVAYYAIKAS